LLEKVLGTKNNPLATNQLLEAFNSIDATGTLYIGYPIIASADEKLTIDALLTSIEYGIVIFDLGGNAAPNIIGARQDDLYNSLYQRLLGFKELRKARGLAAEINVITLLPSNTTLQMDDARLWATPQNIEERLKECAPITAGVLKLVNAAIQRITTIKPPRKRTNVIQTNSKGAILKKIEREIANLDQWQKRAAIESPDAPQRIRGLAGSGKTVVLALKAAYFHARNPEWRIALTFNTRSLYQQFQDLVRRFTFEHINDEPDWTKLVILHAWGSLRQPGVYSEIAAANGIPVKDFLTARQLYGYTSAFNGVCKELLENLKDKTRVELYDAVLIDEAQDMPQAFFELVYLATREPKRVIWAYDELQNLGAYAMAPPSELFGVNEKREPRVPALHENPDEPTQDIILPVCYRNTPWALTIAHALGFGIYRQTRLVQFFDDASLWRDIGYTVLAGTLAAGAQVTLKRAENSYPPYFKQLLTPEDAVQAHVFEATETQAAWVAQQVKQNITQDELDMSDILIILADPLTAKAEAGKVMRALSEQGLSSHLAGVTSSTDQLFTDASVAISGIYRAKGNEAAMVYVLNADHCVEGVELIKRRNTLFTAITRSRAWVRICGVGPRMQLLKAEMDKVIANNYQLSFRVPTADELQLLRKIHRDMTPEEQEKAKRAQKDLEEIVELLDSGDIATENLPEPLLERIRQHLNKQ
jgi:superfamily I DNA and RNA helicase